MTIRSQEIIGDLARFTASALLPPDSFFPRYGYNSHQVKTPRKYRVSLHPRTSHQALPHSRRRRPRGEAEGRGQGHHRTGYRRTGFRYAAAHQGRRHRGDQQGLHQVHRRRRHPYTQAGDHRQVQARQRAGLHREADPGVLRRQAELLQPGAGHHQSRRRGDHHCAVLGVLSRHRDHRRGQAGDRAGRHRAGIQADARSNWKRRSRPRPG